MSTLELIKLIVDRARTCDNDAHKREVYDPPDAATFCLTCAADTLDDYAA